MFLPLSIQKFYLCQSCCRVPTQFCDYLWFGSGEGRSLGLNWSWMAGGFLRQIWNDYESKRQNLFCRDLKCSPWIFQERRNIVTFFSTKYLAIVFCTLSNLTTLPSDEVGVSSLIYIWAKWDPERSGTCKAYRKQCRTGLETQVGISWRTPTLTHHHLPDSRCPGRSCLPSSGWGLMSAPESKWQREVISPGPFSPLNLGRNPRAINTPPAWQRTLLKLTDDFAEKRKP